MTTHAPSHPPKSPQHWGDVGGPPLAHTTVVSTQEKAVLGKERKKVKMQKQTYFSPATTRTSQHTFILSQGYKSTMPLAHSPRGDTP